MPMRFTESIVEDAALDYFRVLGYAVLFSPDIASEESSAK